jgi:hypothetical protein
MVGRPLYSQLCSGLIPLAEQSRYVLISMLGKRVYGK